MSPDARKPSFDSAETVPTAAGAQVMPAAWQPLTFTGVAAFAFTRIGRLILWQFIVAGITATVMLWFLRANWYPVVSEAIARLPDQGLIQNQQLSVPLDGTTVLAENSFLAFVADPEGEGTPTLSTDLRVEFHRRGASVCSVFGCIPVAYPEGFIVQFNRPELESHWGAWKPTVTWGAALGTIAWLLLSWIVLATSYCPFVRLYAFYKDRQLTLAGSWKLSAAALLPAALAATVCIVLYGLGAMNLLQFLIFWSLHLVVGWVYLVVSPLRLPRVSDALPKKKNPFGDGAGPVPDESADGSAPASDPEGNPS
jgi:hypothetical protein